MKTIDNLTSLDQATYRQKATFLHLLFPAQIPPFIDFVESVCNTFIEDQALYHSKWADGKLSFEEWLILLEDVKSEIAFYKKAILESPYVFGKMLFTLDRPFVLIYCLTLYTSVRKPIDPKFGHVVSLFFDEPVAHWYDLPKIAEEPTITEYILSAENSPDTWVCICGNMAEEAGFYPCNTEGNVVEPVDDWDGLNVCMDCGRFFHQDKMLVVGRNYDPKYLDVNDEP